VILLRLAAEADLPLIMAWRSNPLIWQGFYQQREPLIWENHLKWWQSRNRDWRQFMIVLSENDRMRDVGVVTIGQLDHWEPELGYLIGETSLWGKGVGKESVWQAMEWLRNNGYKYTHTTVLKDNTRSRRLLKSLGFREAGKAREGEIRMVCAL